MSSIRYCISIYGTCGTTQLHRVQKLINFSARIISGKRKYDHISQDVRRLGFLSASALTSFHQLTLAKNVLLTRQPADLHAMFEFVHHTHHTRQIGQLQIPRVRTNAGKRRLTSAVAAKYKALPADIRDSRTKSSFKSALLNVLNDNG